MAVIESFGATTLDTDASNQIRLTPSGGSPVVLKYGGVNVTTATFASAGWSVLGAELVNGVYEVVWKNASQYVIWRVDTNGNFLSQGSLLAGSSPEIRAREAGFNQDFNGNGIELPAVVENTGVTRLSSIANTYLLSPAGSSLGVQLKYNGALVAAGQFGAWTPRAAELSGGMYRVVWKNGAADQYIAWNVDTAGNFVSQGAIVSGNSYDAQSYETTMQNDFNGDGTTGLTTSSIEATGNTTLTRVADAYFFNYGTTNIRLRYGGGYVSQGQFGNWAPLAAELSGGMYRVVWKNGALDQYVAWNVDTAGNYVSQGAIVSGGTMAAQSYETTMQYDFNGDGVIGLLTTSVETSGATTLTRVADSYFFNYGTASSRQLLYGGSGVTFGQFGNWTIRGAELNGGVYQVVWKNGTLDQYTVWTVDANGNYMSQSAFVTGANALIQTLEPGFNQDLDSSGGIAARSVIEATGSTTLATVASSYVVSATGSLLGQVLKYGGSIVSTGQFAGWNPIAAELSGGMYRVVWKNGSNYVAWNVDANGNWASQGATVAGSTWWVQSYEPTMQFDLNGDGIIGPTTTTIETGGNTSLTRVADSYFFNYGSQNLQVRYGGSYAAVGQFGAWTPLAAELSGGMYRMVWKNGSADQYVAWNIDVAGNYVSQGAIVGGGTWPLQSYEPTMQYDLNGDGIIGPVVTTIETSGVSSLTRAADSYFINYGTQNLQIKYGGNYAAAGQFGAWTPVAAELTNGSYVVMWKNGSADNYIVWNVDGAGNFAWQNATAFSSGSSLFQAMEASFQQDINGGGIATGTTLEAVGSVILRNVGGYLLLDAAGSVAGPLLSWVDNNYVTASQGGTALGAEWTGSGYQVAWKTGTDTYNFWNTDTAGRYVSQTGNLSGSSAQMQSFEPTFGQDLNGDGVIGVNNNPFDIQFIFSGNQSYNSYFEAAAQKWERIIRGDLPSVTTSQYGTIDDLLITASVASIDPNYLAVANFDARRSGSTGLPYLGHMTFNSIYMDQMVRDGILTSVITHEMGHVLGIGTLWSSFGLVSGFSYIGTNANNAYHQLGGSGFIAVENVGGAASVGSHWRESVFDSELMTSVSEAHDPMPLSTMTIGALQDLGYVVNYGAADSYRIPGIGLAAAGSDGADGSLAPEAYREAYASSLNPDASQAPESYREAYASSPNPDASLVPEAYLAEYLNSIGGTAGSTAPGPDVGNVSLLTNYMANSFVTSAGEGTANIVPTETNPADVLTRPYA